MFDCKMSLFNQNLASASITAFYHLNLTHFEMNMHSHLSCEIMYVKKGDCTIETSTERYTLHDGEFIFLDSYAPHCLSVQSKSSCTLLNLEFKIDQNGTIPLNELRSHSRILKQTKNLPNNYLVAYDNRNLNQPLESLIQLLTSSPNQNHSSENDYLIKLLFQQCLLELSYFFDSSKLNVTSPYLINAINYIHAHLQEDLRVPDIANYVGINKSYLHLLFSQHLNSSISNYINHKRLEQARFLLANSERSITDIAFDVGYNSRQHFSNTFSRYFNQSPQAYRTKNKSKDLVKDTKGQFRKDSTQWEMIKMKD